MKTQRIFRVLFFIVVFGFPVLWYLFLQSFGENKFVLPNLGAWDNDCVSEAGVVCLNTSDSLSFPNELMRIRAKMRSVTTLTLKEVSSDSCKMQKDIYLVDHQGNIRGEFDLGRLETDRLMAEIDIYLLNTSTEK